MHRNVRALSRGLALIGELNASGPSNAVQLAKRTGLNRTTCYRLLDTLREDGYVTFDETNALFGLTPQVRTLSEGVSSRDLSSQAALPAMFSLLDQVSWPSDFGVFELGLGADPREHTSLQSILGPSLDGGPQAVAGAQRAGAGNSRCVAACATPRDARDDGISRRGRRTRWRRIASSSRQSSRRRRKTATRPPSEGRRRASALSRCRSKAAVQCSVA